MKLNFVVAAATLAAAALSAGAASAAPVVAKLQAPVAAAAKPVAGGAVFNCLGDVCAASAPSADTATLRGCRDLVRQVGPVASFGSLTEDRRGACNTAAQKK